MTDLQIVSLADHPQYVDVCAAWVFGEWGCLLDGSLEGARLRYLQCLKTDMPCAFVALKDGKPVGTVSLRKEDFTSRPDLSPWIGSMYVHPFHRKEGIASRLAIHAEIVARDQLGVRKLYLITELALNIYSRLGWKKIGEYPDKFARPGIFIHLMEKDLT
jgi:GNAT superfamily N-acetyltransferase